MLVIATMVLGIAVGACLVCSAYDAAEGHETFGDLVARLAGEMVR